MKEMTLHDVQAVSLDIMKHLHTFCVNNDIKYSLGYGSLIGAIRHKGFIPWDDDMDIVMMREDFERFCKLYNDTTEYKLFSYNRRNTYSLVARICDIKKTYVKTGSPLFTEETGLWIDIFPLDTVEKDKTVFEDRKNAFKEINSKIFQCRWQIRRYELRDLFHLKSYLSWVKHVRHARHSIWDLVKAHNDMCLAHNNENSPMMSMLAFPIYIDKDYSPKRVFDEVIDAPFEDTTFKIMKGYDEWLRIIYGDYMTPPPVEKQKRGHLVHKYYWK